MTGLLDAAYDGITRVLDPLDDAGLGLRSRCSGWSVANVTFHLLLDAQRALVTLATPTAAPPDVDAVSYWTPHKPGAPWASAHEEFVRRSTAAYSSPQMLVRQWTGTAAAAARAAAVADPVARVATQGHVLTVADFVSTLVVEVCVHHLDLTVSLPDAPEPVGPVLAHVRDVLDRMLGARAPVQWPTTDYALAAGGRVEVPDDVRAALGSVAESFPLLG